MADQSHHRRPAPPRVLLLAVLAAAAFALYAPALRTGLLSDDFALLTWARTRDFLPASWEFVRPLPLMIWAVVASVAPIEAQPLVLHVVNVLVHAISSWLVFLLARQLGASAAASVSAAVLFLCFPAAVEPVVWVSAFPDVLLACSALTLCVIAIRREQLTVPDQLVCLSIACLMLATKESGIAAGPLVLLCRWMRWGLRSRTTYVVVALIAGIGLTYAMWRVQGGRIDRGLLPGAERDAVRRLVEQSFGTFLLPLHTDVRRAVPQASLLLPAVVTLLAASVVWRWPHAPLPARLGLLAAATTVVWTVPGIRAFWVLEDLQGSRYIYLPAAFWSLALASALNDGWPRRWQRVSGAILTIVLLVGSVLAIRAHLEPWRRAARARDVVLFHVRSLPRSCRRVHLTDVPDHVGGAYVFRNGLTQAAAMSGREIELVGAADAAPECRLDVAAGAARIRR